MHALAENGRAGAAIPKAYTVSEAPAAEEGDGRTEHGRRRRLARADARRPRRVGGPQRRAPVVVEALLVGGRHARAVTKRFTAIMAIACDTRHVPGRQVLIEPGGGPKHCRNTVTKGVAARGPPARTTLAACSRRRRTGTHDDRRCGVPGRQILVEPRGLPKHCKTHPTKAPLRAGPKTHAIGRGVLSWKQVTDAVFQAARFWLNWGALRNTAKHSHKRRRCARAPSRL